MYCPDEHLSVRDIHEATRVYATFAALALRDHGGDDAAGHADGPAGRLGGP